jgi:hypothetical protein
VEAAEAYRDFASAQPADTAAPLASLFQGVIVLRELGKADQARAAFQRAEKTPDTALGRAVRHAARAWLARLQMEQVGAALRAYWVDHIEYPPSLKHLVREKLLDKALLNDPWGKAVVYKTGRLSIAPDMPRQAYTLRCSAIEGTSEDFERVLKASKGFGQGYTLRGTAPGPPMRAIIATPQGQTANVTEGATAGEATVVRIEEKAAVISDGQHVAVLTP